MAKKKKNKKSAKASTEIVVKEKTPLEVVLAETTYDLMFKEQCHDPRAEEIARAYFGSELLIPGDFIVSVRQRLGKIRDILDRTHDMAVHPVTEAFYGLYKRKVPEKLTQQRRCIPGNGRGSKAYGLRCVFDVDEPLYFQTMLGHMRRSAGQLSKVLKRFNREVVTERATTEKIVSMCKRHMETEGIPQSEIEFLEVIMPKLEKLGD